MKKICFVINAESPHIEVNSEDLSKLRDDKFLGYDYSTIGICNNERKINRLDTEFAYERTGTANISSTMAFANSYFGE
jgi:hypothetical protein